MGLAEKLSDVPMPVKVLGAVAGGGGLLGVSAIFGVPTTYLAIIAGGMILVAALVLAYQGLMKLRDAGKANPFTKLITGAAGGSPSGAIDPAMRARLDDLRKKFEDGVEKFKSAGKNLYAIPWYLLVGEPGSGKSFLIRKVGKTGNWFPPGLQDELQGTGGTINMHWWLTNYAVVLDTAGKMLMQEVKPGENSEWREFLKLIKIARQDCPVNGLLLVIPADTLIKDKAEAIEKKAGTIARQLDMIQRTLDVRFPVYVIITKCDLITGFRDFFEYIDDPTAQQQMLGWTNPAELDTPFSPDEVDKHLAQVKDRLMRRRMGQLVDPVHTEDPRDRRINQVDSMFALPEAMMKLGPRLRRYLEMVFVAGEWSPKPLFLRGIYFNSSVQEGGELDEMLAAALGVSVDAVASTTPDEKEKSLFARDMFTHKVFKEKGLVTRATNVKGQQRRKQVQLMGGAILLALVFIGMTILGSVSLGGRIDQPKRFWSAVTTAATAPGADMKLLKRGEQSWVYRGGESIKLDSDENKTRLVELFHRTHESANKPISIPGAFRPLAFVLGNVSGDLQGKERAQAHAGLMVTNVLAPVVEAAREKMQDPKVPWTDSATAALAELLRLERDAYAPSRPELERFKRVDDSVSINVNALYQYVLSEDDYKTFLTSEVGSKENDAQRLQAAADWAFTNKKGPGLAWPPSALGAGTDASRRVATAGVTRFLKEGTSAGGKWAILAELRTALESFRDAEDELLKIGGEKKDADLPKKQDDYDKLKSSWDKAFALLTERRDPLAAKASALGTQAASLAQLIADAKADRAKLAEAAYATLMAPLTEAKDMFEAAATAKDEAPITIAYKALRDDRAGLPKKIDTDATELAASLTAYDKPYLERLGGDGSNRAFVARFLMYQKADQTLKPADAAAPFMASADALDSWIQGAQQEIDQYRTTSVESDRRTAGYNAASYALKMARREKMYRVLKDDLAKMPSSLEAISKAVETVAKEDPASLERPKLPLMRDSTAYLSTFSDKFAPVVLARYSAVRQNVKDGSVLEAAELQKVADALSTGYNDFAGEYVKYWSETVFVEAMPSATDWLSVRDAVSTQTGELVTTLKDYMKRSEDALKAVPTAWDGVTPHKDALASIDKSVKSLADKPYIERVDGSRKKWRELTRDNESRATEKVKTMTATQLQEDFFAAYTEREDLFARRYFNGLFLEGLRTLAQSAQGEIRKAVDDLKTRGRRFPLVRDARGGDALSGADLSALVTKLSIVRDAAKKVGGTRRTDGKNIGEGARLNLSSVDDQLAVLCGDRVITADEQNWLDRLEPILRALADDKLSADIRTLKPGMNADAPKGSGELLLAQNRYGAMQLSSGARGMYSTGFPDEALSTSAVSVPSASLSIGFSIAIDPKEFKVIDSATVGDASAGGWGLISAVLHPSSKPVGEKKTWQVPLIFKGSDGNSYYQWILLDFSKDLPDPKEWPTDKDWPSN
jgi:hypothetical protein